MSEHRLAVLNISKDDLLNLFEGEEKIKLLVSQNAEIKYIYIDRQDNTLVIVSEYPAE